MNIEITGRGAISNQSIIAPIRRDPSMLVKNDLLVVLNGYYHDSSLDDMHINALYDQNNNFSVVFIDPHMDKLREDKIKKLETDTGIQSLYLPYQRDPNPRKYDWCVRNIGCLLMSQGRFFHWHQHRRIRDNFFQIVNSHPEDNIGFIRTWIMDNRFFDSGLINYNVEKQISANLSSDKATFQSSESVKFTIHNNLHYCFYDCVLRVDDFIELNGTDEALTSYIYEEDWDIEERWDVAQSMGVVHQLLACTNAMLYFGHTKPQCPKTAMTPQCELCLKDDLKRIRLINHDRLNDIEGLQYLGIIDNYIEWFKCIECGKLYVRTGTEGFGDFSERQKKYKKYKASIGIDGRYGRNLKDLREDVLNSKDWHEACEVINNSWYNKKYYQ